MKVLGNTTVMYSIKARAHLHNAELLFHNHFIIIGRGIFRGKRKRNQTNGYGKLKSNKTVYKHYVWHHRRLEYEQTTITFRIQNEVKPIKLSTN